MKRSTAPIDLPFRRGLWQVWTAGVAVLWPIGDKRLRFVTKRSFVSFPTDEEIRGEDKRWKAVFAEERRAGQAINDVQVVAIYIWWHPRGQTLYI